MLDIDGRICYCCRHVSENNPTKKQRRHHVTYYQLAHNIRRAETKTPVAEVIHNFGRADQLDREELVRLCKSIARICGVVIHDPFTSPQEGKEAGLPKDVRYIQTMELGSVVVIEALWERLGIGETLRRLCREKGCTVPMNGRSLPW